MNQLKELGKYNYYFQFTLTSYGRDVEPNLPSKNKELIPGFCKLSEIIGKGEGKTLIANERQYEAVVKALESLEKAKKTVDDGFFSDLASIDLQDAIGFLGEAEGISINQETVNRIFEKFCLGK